MEKLNAMVMFHVFKGFGKNISRIVLTRDVNKFDTSLCNLVSDVVYLYIDMLCPGNVDRCRENCPRKHGIEPRTSQEWQFWGSLEQIDVRDMRAPIARH